MGPYSQGVAVGGWLFLSGQAPLNPTTGELTERGMENLKAVLGRFSMGLRDVVKWTAYMTNLEEITRMNRVYHPLLS